MLNEHKATIARECLARVWSGSLRRLCEKLVSGVAALVQTKTSQVSGWFGWSAGRERRSAQVTMMVAVIS